MPQGIFFVVILYVRLGFYVLRFSAGVRSGGREGLSTAGMVLCFVFRGCSTRIFSLCAVVILF